MCDKSFVCRNNFKFRCKESSNAKWEAYAFLPANNPLTYNKTKSYGKGSINLEQFSVYDNNIITEEEAMARDAREQLRESVEEAIMRNENEG